MALIESAEEHFDRKLNIAERTAAEALAAGDERKVGTGRLRDTERQAPIDAATLRWLLLRAVDGSGAASGLRLAGARIAGDLILDGLTLPFPILLRNCKLGRVSLEGAEMRTLRLQNCRCRGIEATRVHVTGALQLDQGFRCDGPIRMADATIGTDFNCHRGRFVNPGGRALLFDGTRIGGRALLRRAKFTGKVTAVNSRVEGGFSGSRSTFDNGGGVALSIERIRVNGWIFFRDATAHGRLRLAGASTTSDLHLGRATVDQVPRGKPALDLSRVDVGGRLVLRETDCAGPVRLRNASVRGDVELHSATLAHRVVLDSLSVGGRLTLLNTELGGGDANGISLIGAKVTGRFRWRPRELPPHTKVNLAGACVGSLDDRGARWPQRGLMLEGFSYDTIRDVASKPGWLERRIAWVRSSQRKGRYSPQPYEQLIGVLRRGGHEQQAREVAMAKQDDLRELGDLAGPARASNWVVGKALGHGYRVWPLAILALAVAAIGAALFEVFEADLVAVSGKTDPPTFNAIAYSIDTLLPIIDLGQAGAWLPDGGWLAVWVWLQVASGWILATFIGVGLTGLVRKD